MKKIALILLLALICLTGAAQGEEMIRENVKSLLTEIYGYSAEESEAFQIEVGQENGVWDVSFAHKAHPEWLYTAQYHPDGGLLDSQSPFQSKVRFAYYPGEGTVRHGISQMLSWFADWENTGRGAMLEWMRQCSVHGTRVLQEGLGMGTLPPGNALHEFLLGCYGEKPNWSEPLREWEAELLEQHGLTIEEQPEIKGSVSYQVQLSDRHAPMTVTRFVGEVPKDMLNVCSHPALEGWTPLCGMYGECDDAEGLELLMRMESGLIAFEKDGERLLVMLSRSGEGEWELYSVGKKAILPEREFFITGNPAEQTYEIVYPVSETLDEVYTVRVDDFCRLLHYRRIDKITGEGIEIRVDSYGCYNVTEYRTGGETHQETIEEPQMNLLHLIDLQAFPTTLEACRQAEAIVLPKGYGVAAGVHLRARTSSRSKDLGDYNAGTLVEILDSADGDPYDWYKVRIGSAVGYMSSAYVDYEGSVCMMQPLVSRPLPVGEAKQSVKLCQNKGLFGTGLFAQTVREIPEGTRMHVLAECGEWLHVMIPSGEITWIMDVNGTDGYVKKDHIREINLMALPLNPIQ